MDDRLRRSAAHVLVSDVSVPTADEAATHHLRRVLRLRDGASVTVTDGRGTWRPCVLSRHGLDEAGDAVLVAAQPPVTILVAPPKGDRLQWLVAKCTEVGVDRITLVDAQRSVVRWDAERADRQLGRLRRIVLEASMQSRRVWFPTIDGPVAASLALVDAVGAEPGGRPVDCDDMSIGIGPEGGWAPEELASARDIVSLGPTILRVETAAVSAAVQMVAARSGARS
jgi:16S rRNA (uracil1498-N3)-methyltransferase